MPTEPLSHAVDQVNEAAFYARKLPAAERKRLAASIAAHQGLPGAYGQSFALSAEERSAGIRVFTGERMTSASARHIAGEEACRALILLGAEGAGAAGAALARASEGLRQAVLGGADESGSANGTFCCTKCSVALWRHLAAGGFDRCEQRLADGLAHLKKRRDPEGGWGAFPFFYTLLALLETDAPAATRELRHAAPACELKLRRRSTPSTYAQRQRAVLERALARV